LNHGDTESTENGIPAELNDLVSRVIGAAIEVHRVLGPGYLESVYEAAMRIELDTAQIPFDPRKSICVSYKGREVGQARLDFLVERQLILELKAVDKLGPIHRAQMISYLKATGCRLGLVINFNDKTLRDGIMRVAL
jgi:GxxExxY protein